MKLRRIGAVLAAVALALALAPGGAHARVHAYAEYDLSITDSDGVQTWVTLTCYPHGGTHPDAHGACEALEEAGGDFEALVPLDEPCTLEYDPVSVRAHGHWGGYYDVFASSYGNRCLAGVETGGVFRF